ncbi:MAG: trypsin-like peptidase domain-containing protein [Leptolyngbyaceae cyanobacterium]
MQNLWSRCLRTGAYVLGTTASLTLTGTLTPSTPLDWQSWSILPAAIAQDVEEQTNIEVYRAASPAVVSVEAGEGSGSGSIITADGLVLTNAHVVGGESTARVRLADGREFTGDVIGFPTSRVDLAAIRLRNSPGDLPTIDIAPANSVEVGQRAFAIGNPFGLEGTFTVGIVSRIDPERGLIQTDAAINPGNSGGPLLGSDGRLIGVNVSIFTTQQSGGNIGIGFAIPVAEVESFIAEVRNGTALTTASVVGNGGGRPPEAIAVNDIVSGELSSGSDVLPDGSFFDAYIFEGRRGQQVAIEMISRDLDPYLILLSQDSDSLYLEDDDSAGEFNARLVTTLPADGEYIILANSFGRGEQGSYDLRLSEVDGRVGTAPETNGDTFSGPFLLQESGLLARGDSLAPDGTLYDEYSFNGEPGQTVTIRLESSEFDTYLAVVDSLGNLIAENDDADSNSTNSEVSFALPDTGPFLIIVNGYSTSDQGQYRLTVR